MGAGDITFFADMAVQLTSHVRRIQGEIDCAVRSSYIKFKIVMRKAERSESTFCACSSR